jgi:hypothetical protein
LSKISDIIHCTIIDLKILLIILIVLSIISSILVYVLTSSAFSLELQFVFSNWVIDISAGLALLSAFIVILREKSRKNEMKKYVSLFVGILFWFSAEIVYTYYQTVFKIDIPYPSYADILWLLGYIFVGYHLYSAFYFWNKNKKFSESSVFIITIFTALLIHLLAQSSIATYSNNTFLILVDILYHTADGAILIPALILLWNLRSEQILFIHRALISLAIVLNTFANVGYIFSFNLGQNIALEYAWVWDIVYNFSYILLAGALFWYDKILQILNKKIEQSIIANKKQLVYLEEKQDKSKIIENNSNSNSNSYLNFDKEEIKDIVNTWIDKAKTEISLVIYVQNEYNYNLIKNLNLLLTDSNININNNLKIRILFDTSSNLKLLLSKNFTTSLLNIEYRKIVKPLGFDILAFIIDNQQLISIDLKQCVNINQSLAIYLTNNNSILRFCNLFDNLWALSELKEQDSKYNK